jgi:hypothetical protein
MLYVKVPEQVERAVDLVRKFYPICVPCKKGYLCMPEEHWHMAVQSLQRLDEDLYNAEPKISWKFISETGSIFADVFLVTETGLTFIVDLDMFLRVCDSFALCSVLVPSNWDVLDSIQYAEKEERTKVDNVPDHFVSLEVYL